MSKKKDKANKRLHKMVISAFLTLTMMLLMPLNCKAEEKVSTSEAQEKVDEILKDFESLLPDGYGGVSDPGEASESLGIKRILESVFLQIKRNGTQISTFLITLLGISLLGALSSLWDSETGNFASRAVGTVSSALLFERLLHLIVGAMESLREIGNFFGTVIPVCLAVNTLGASPTTATTQAVGMGITLAIYSFISDKLVLPVVSVIFVTSAVSSVDPMFARISSGVKSLFLWIMGIFSALVGATFSLQSVISASADNAVIRSARYAISGTVPIVGGVVSGALGVLSGGVTYARGAVGGGAVAVIVSMILSPLVTLLLYRTCLRAGVFFASVSSSVGCAGIMTSFVGALDSLIAAYSLTSVIYIAELVAFLKGGATIA